MEKQRNQAFYRGGETTSQDSFYFKQNIEKQGKGKENTEKLRKAWIGRET